MIQHQQASPRPGDSKKRSKPLNTDDGDKNTGAKDPNAARGQKKGGEGTGKAKEDQPNKRLSLEGVGRVRKRRNLWPINFPHQ